RIRELAELLRQRARRLVAQRVAGEAAVGLDDVEPLALALQILGHAVALRPGTREVAGGRHRQQRIPIERRVILRRRLGVARRGRGRRSRAGRCARSRRGIAAPERPAIRRQPRSRRQASTDSSAETASWPSSQRAFYAARQYSSSTRPPQNYFVECEGLHLSP